MAAVNVISHYLWILQVFAVEQSTVLQGLKSREDGAHFLTPSTGQAPVDMDALAAEDLAAEAMDTADAAPEIAIKQSKCEPSRILTPNACVTYTYRL